MSASGIWWTAAAVLVLLMFAWGGAWAEESDLSAMATLRWRQGQVDLTRIDLVPQRLRMPAQQAGRGPALQLEDDARGIVEVPFRIPRTLHYDYVEPATGRLAGGAVMLEEVEFALRIPWTWNTRDLVVRTPDGRRHRLDLARAAAKAFQPAPWPATKVIDNGPDDRRYVMVVLGDGYQSHEMAKYATDTANLMAYLFGTTPWSNYQTYVNVYRVNVVSAQSGADHPNKGRYVNTSLDATFGSGALERLLTVSNAKALAAATDSVDVFDAVLVLVNDSEYGGSGGSVAVTSTHSQAPEILVHEVGHMFAGLADEYEDPYPGYPAGDSEPNVTYQVQRHLIKWNAWIAPGTPVPTTPPSAYPNVVGLFQGARYFSSGIYRPKLNCKMRSLQVPFCEVCREAHVMALYQHPAITPIVEVSPPTATAIGFGPGEDLVFTVTPQTPVGHVLEAKWYVNGTLQPGTSAHTFTLDTDHLSAATDHWVSVEVTDATPMVRTDPTGLLVEERTWSLLRQAGIGPGDDDPPYRLGDVNLDGNVDAVDVQLVINAALGMPITGDADINASGHVDAMDIQLVINIVLGV